MKRATLLVGLFLVLGWNSGLVGPALQGKAAGNQDLETDGREPNVVPQQPSGPTSSLIPSYATHDPILISSNIQFISLGFPGSGTSGDPYRIEGWDITHSTGPLIEIRDTTVYFEIRDNLLNGLNQTATGISLSNTLHGTIVSNTIHDNTEAAIRLEASGTLITNNSLYDNPKTGIYIEGGFNNTITGNTLTHNGLCGIELWFSSDNTITNNTIAYHTYGTVLLSSANNMLKWNDFIQNNRGGTSQAFDDSASTTFTSNYWDDWTSPDVGNDGFVDNPYAIEGAGNQQDQAPLVAPATLSFVPLVLLYPNGGETLSGNVTVEWTPAVAPLGHAMGYSVYCSTDGGNSWTVLAANLTAAQFVWDIGLTEAQSTNCLIKVVASSDIGLTVEDISDEPFTIEKEVPADGPGGGSDDLMTLLLAILVLLVSILIIANIGFGYFLFKSRIKEDPSFDDYMQSAQIEALEALHYKVIMGLENYSLELLAEPLEVPSPASADQELMINYFRPDIRDDLKAAMKGRTVLTLIEIAFQSPTEINPTELSKVLNIPRTTISTEIKRLVELEYIESSAPSKALRDARYNYYSITSKGATFLQTLKGALDIALIRLRERGPEIVL